MNTRENFPILKKRDHQIKLEESIDEKFKEIKELLDFRFNQSYASRLSEYITGLRPEDPKMVDRLIEDQKIIRTKYDLPYYYEFNSIPEYEDFLYNIAKKYGTDIRTKSECGKFFDEVPFANGVAFGDINAVGLNIDKETDKTYTKSLLVLEHELIHVMQKNQTPAMPTEHREYEAYISGLNIDAIREHPNDLEVIFSFLIGGSVNTWYNLESKEKGELLKPKWNNPEYFLTNVDKIDQRYIDEYKEKITQDKPIDVEITS